MNKADLRRLIRVTKRTLTQADKIQAARLVFERVENLDLFKRASNILLYHSLPDELSTIEFIEKWESEKRIYLPRVNGRELDVLPYDKALMATGAFNIEEPTGTDITPIGVIDLIIVPAVAYDTDGNRLGRGKGFYDRLLSRCRAIKIGVAYDFQLVEEIAAEPHDVKVDMIVTEKRMITLKND